MSPKLYYHGGDWSALLELFDDTTTFYSFSGRHILWCYLCPKIYIRINWYNVKRKLSPVPIYRLGQYKLTVCSKSLWTCNVYHTHNNYNVLCPWFPIRSHCDWEPWGFNYPSDRNKMMIVSLTAMHISATYHRYIYFFFSLIKIISQVGIT